MGSKIDVWVGDNRVFSNIAYYKVLINDKILIPLCSYASIKYLV